MSDLVEVWLVEKSVKEGAGIRKAVGADDVGIRAEAVTPGSAQPELPGALDEEDHIAVDCIERVHGVKIQPSHAWIAIGCFPSAEATPLT